MGVDTNRGITLAKALSYKKRVTGEIARLTGEIRLYNSRRLPEEPQVNVEELLKRRSQLTEHLVDLKVSIALQNREIQRKIFLLAELKSDVAFYSSVPVTHGKKLEDSYTAGPSEVEYVAVLKKADVDKKVAELNHRIDNLQDELDKFNYTASISIEDVGL